MEAARNRYGGRRNNVRVRCREREADEKKTSEQKFAAVSSEAFQRLDREDRWHFAQELAGNVIGRPTARGTGMG